MYVCAFFFWIKHGGFDLYIDVNCPCAVGYHFLLPDEFDRTFHRSSWRGDRPANLKMRVEEVHYLEDHPS